MLKIPATFALVVACATGSGLAQGSDPRGAADMFVPVLAGVAASDMCAEPGCPFSLSPGFEVDVLGQVYPPYVRSSGDLCPICGGPFAIGEYRLQRVLPGGGTEVLGFFRERCNPLNFSSHIESIVHNVDPFSGVDYVRLSIRNTSCTSTISTYTTMVKITGLPTLFDVQVTFEPAAGTVSWSVPRHPFALPAADRFEVFTGNLGDLPEFGLARPVECSLPAGGPPAPGSRLTITDPLDDPPIGKGRYLLVAAERLGERRFGRQRIGNVMTGRDPNQFPACF